MMIGRPRELAEIFVVAFLVGLGVCIGGWELDNEPPLAYISLTPIDGGTVEAGGLVTYSRTFCTKRPDVPGMIQRTLIGPDGAMVFLPATLNRSVAGCPVTSRYSLLVPPALQPGPWIYRVAIHYDLNPLRSISVPIPDVTFRISAEH